MKTPIKYVKDSLIIAEKFAQQKSLIVNQDLRLNVIDAQCKSQVQIISDELSYNQNMQIYNNIIVMADDIILIENKRVYYPKLTINQSLIISDHKYKLSNANEIQFKQIVVFKENWCNSDNIYNSNLITYNVNSDIFVNNVVYNSFNICRYKFDIRDDFSFFAQDKKQLVSDQVDIKTIAQISGQDISQTKQQLLSDKLQIDNKQYKVVSNIDGLILNNNIHLSVGKHRIKIRKINTPQVFFFDIEILAPYRRQFDKIYMLDLYDLTNAKFYSNYYIQQIQLSKEKIFDNNITIV